MPFVFLSVIGGFITMVFLRLFIGAIILSIGYKLLEGWMAIGDEATPADEDRNDDTKAGE